MYFRRLAACVVLCGVFAEQESNGDAGFCKKVPRQTAKVSYVLPHTWDEGPGFGSASQVLFIGIDGYGSYYHHEEFGGGPFNVSSPFLDGLRATGAYSPFGRAVMPTVSKPNWMSMIAGAGPEEHGMIANPGSGGACEMEPITGRGTYFPSMFQAIKDQSQDTKIAVWGTWEPFFSNFPTSIVDEWLVHPRDLEVMTTIYIDEIILPNQYQMMYFYSGHLDNVGHASGWGSPEYYEAITDLDESVGRMLNALEQAGTRNTTTIIIGVDHGGVGTSHGAADIFHLYVPVIINGPQVKSGFLFPCTNAGYSCYQVNGRQVRNMDTPSTALYVLRFEQPDVWIGRPLTEAFLGS